MSVETTAQDEIRALTLLAGQQKRLQDDMDELKRELKDINAALIRIEAQDLKGKNAEITVVLKALENRLGVLEAGAQRRAGANGLVEWLSRNGPLLVAGAIALGAWFGWAPKNGGGH